MNKPVAQVYKNQPFCETKMTIPNDFGLRSLVIQKVFGQKMLPPS